MVYPQYRSLSVTVDLDALLRDYDQPSGGVHIGISRIEEQISLYNLDFDPAYQRDHVWSTEQRAMFVGALIAQPDQIPPCVIRVIPAIPGGHRERFQVLDGKQRITSVRLFRQGLIRARIDATEFFWEHLAPEDRLALSHICMRWTFVTLPDDKAAIRYYLRLNTGGTVHSPEELARVRRLLES